MKAARLALAVAVWWMFGCSGAKPLPADDARDALTCAAMTVDLLARLERGEACEQARDAAREKVPGCPWPVKCPGDDDDSP